MKKQTLRMLSLMLSVLALLLVTLTASAETYDGHVSITVGRGDSLFERKNIRLSLYILARGDFDHWKIENGFSGAVFTQRSDGSIVVNKTMKQIQARVHEVGLAPYRSANTDAAGEAVFTNLPRGIYFVEMVSGPQWLEVTPMILSAPDKTGQVQINVNAKYDYKPPVDIPPEPGDKLHEIDEYETALGLGNIQMHVGVCFE